MTESNANRFFILTVCSIVAAGLFLSACTQEQPLPDDLNDPTLLPAAVRASPLAFCQSALERHRQHAPDLVERVGAIRSAPTGEFPPTDRATCFFALATGETALVVFEARCDDPSNPDCVIALGISTGREGWIDPDYYQSQMQNDDRVRRLQAPAQERDE